MALGVCQAIGSSLLEHPLGVIVCRTSGGDLAHFLP